MNRRIFLSSVVAGLTSASTLGSFAAHAGDAAADYTPGMITDALAAGKTVFVDYAADWCGTCRRQARVISQLRSENPAYDDAMIFVRVDWDDYRSHDVTTSRNIPRRSTLLVLRGEDELGRLVAETGSDSIRDLMDKGLSPDA